MRPKSDHFVSLVCMWTKSAIADFYGCSVELLRETLSAQLPDLVVQQGYELCPEVNLIGGGTWHHYSTQGTIKRPACTKNNNCTTSAGTEQKRYIQHTF